MDLAEVESELLEGILDMDRQKKFDVRDITAAREGAFRVFKVLTSRPRHRGQPWRNSPEFRYR
jgi:hypothetical protein